jgi:hypothetical protein
LSGKIEQKYLQDLHQVGLECGKGSRYRKESLENSLKVNLNCSAVKSGEESTPYKDFDFDFFHFAGEKEGDHYDAIYRHKRLLPNGTTPTFFAK